MQEYNKSLVWDRRFGWFLLIIDSVSSRESTCNIAGCIATSSPSSPGYYAPPLSTPLIPRRRHERSTPPPLPPSSSLASFWTSKAYCLIISRGRGAKNLTDHSLFVSRVPSISPVQGFDRSKSGLGQLKLVQCLQKKASDQQQRNCRLPAKRIRSTRDPLYYRWHK